MATGVQSLEKLGRVTGKSFSTLDRIARALKQDARRQWVLGTPGGGKNSAHVTKEHLVNIGFGLGADPITSAPETVEEFGDLQCQWQSPNTERSAVRRALKDWSDATRPVVADGGLHKSAPTAREALVDLVDRLSNKKHNELRSTLNSESQGVGNGCLRVKLCLEEGSSSYLKVEIFETIEGRSEWNLFSHFVSKSPTYSAALGAVGKTITIPYHVFEVMGDLWADTQDHMKLSHTTLAPTISQNDTAASQPLQGPSAAVVSSVSDQLEKKLGGPLQFHPTREREKPQPHASQAGRSSNLNRSDPRHGARHDDGYRHSA